jgi:hypothetical protein
MQSVGGIGPMTSNTFAVLRSGGAFRNRTAFLSHRKVLSNDSRFACMAFAGGGFVGRTAFRSVPPTIERFASRLSDIFQAAGMSFAQKDRAELFGLPLYGLFLLIPRL